MMCGYMRKRHFSISFRCIVSMLTTLTRFSVCQAEPETLGSQQVPKVIVFLTDDLEHRDEPSTIREFEIVAGTEDFEVSVEETVAVASGEQANVLSTRKTPDYINIHFDETN